MDLTVHWEIDYMDMTLQCEIDYMDMSVHWEIDYTRRQNKRPPQALAGPLKPLKCSQKAEIFCASRH